MPPAPRRHAACQAFCSAVPAAPWGCNVSTDLGDSTVRYAIDAQDDICFVDETWCRFAEANDAAELMPPAILGRALWDFVVDPTTRKLYRQMVSRARQGHHARFTLRCDGPAFRRLLEMRIRSAPGRVVHFETHTLRVEARTSVDLLARNTTRTSDVLRACAWCNRLNVGSRSTDWVEVEDAVNRLRLFERERAPQLSHGICEACLASMTHTVENMGSLPSP